MAEQRPRHPTSTPFQRRSSALANGTYMAPVRPLLEKPTFALHGPFSALGPPWASRCSRHWPVAQRWSIAARSQTSITSRHILRPMVSVQRDRLAEVYGALRSWAPPRRAKTSNVGSPKRRTRCTERIAVRARHAARRGLKAIRAPVKMQEGAGSRLSVRHLPSARRTFKS